VTPDTVISGAGGIDTVREFLVGARGRRALCRELAAMVAHDHAIAGLRLHRAKLKPGRKLSGWYTVDVADVDGGRSRWEAAVTWMPAQGDMEAAGPVGDSPDPTRSAPFRALERRLPRWGLRIRVFPLDSEFPGLARLADVSAVSALVPVAFPPPTSVVAIRYRPGERHVLRYTSAAGAGARTVFAKVHREAAAASARTAAVADWLAGERCPVAALHPLAVLPAEHAVVYPGLDGRPLLPEPRDLRRAGMALRALHSAPPDVAAGAVAHGFDGELAAVGRACEHVGVLLPDAGRAIAAMLGQARAAYGRLADEPATLVHGDAKLDHFWSAPRGLTLLDLDRSCPDDPAFDVGKLLADLRWRFALSRTPGVADAQRGLLDGYGCRSAARLGRARVFEAVFLLKIAGRRVPLFHPRWADMTFGLLAAARAALEQTGDRPARRRASAHRTPAGAAR
jgi:aminoglycoside phosphotransferase (APT) family kinase protein